MKNIFLLNTNGPSKLYHHSNGELQLRFNMFKSDEYSGSNQHMYIISDDKITIGDWVIKISSIYIGGGLIQKYSFVDELFEGMEFKKIILTTDRSLILDDVQEINDEFLEWYIQNPNCEFVEVEITPDLQSFDILSPLK